MIEGENGVRQRIDAPASKKRDWQGGNGA